MNNRYLLNYVKKYWYFVLLTILLATILSALMLSIPIFVGEAIDKMIGINEVSMAEIKKLLIIILVITLIIAIINLSISIINNNITYSITNNIRRFEFKKIQKLQLKYIDNNPHGEIVNTIINDIDLIGEGLLLGFNGLFTNIITIILTIVILFIIAWPIAIILLLLSPLSIFVSRFIATKSFSLFSKQADIRGKETDIANEMITNIQTIKILNREDYSIDLFNKANEDLRKASLKSVFFSSLPNPTTRFINAIIYAIIGITIVLLVIKGENSIGNVATILALSTQFTKPFNELSGIISELQNAYACMHRVEKFLNEREDIDKSSEVYIKENTLKMENISFSYNDKPFINDFNMIVNNGKHIAIVGPTGCGKTTIINLIMRFYRPNSGEIHLGYYNINNISAYDLRKKIGMVLQDTWIRNDTVFNNITLGKSKYKLDDVKRVCIACHIDSFIQKLPLGYDTIINENSNLSLGQKQLLCIARVMITKPDILILDEATSNIDTSTEMDINNAFNILMKGKTSIIIAHRLKTILNADTIIVMKDGKIIESGRHQELMMRNGFYTELFNSQFKH